MSESRTSTWRTTVAFLRESLGDNNADFTTGRSDRAVGLLAVPMMLEMSTEAIVISESLLTAMSVVVFTLGRWKRRAA